MLQKTAINSSTTVGKNGLIGSVQRALSVMELLAQYPEGLNAKQIGYHLHLHLSTCYHLLNTLIIAGYVIKDSNTRSFRLSGKIGYTVFGQATPAQLVQQLTPHVQALQETTHETAYLSLWDGQEITLSAIVESPLSVRVKTLTIGYTEANHAMALGKSILAYLDDKLLARYLDSHPLTPFTDNTLTSPTALKQHLQTVRQQGYSLDIEEYLPDVYCISAPIFDAQQQITAAIAISLPGHRYNTHQQKLITEVQKAAQAATRTLQILGYIGPSTTARENS